MSIDLRRLGVFCRVVEKKSFSKAAEQVFLSQPTVSEHIRLLEQFLGERLLDRLGKEVIPTQAGEILYRYARQILALKEEAIQAIEDFKGKVGGKLRIGGSTIPSSYILPYCLGSFSKLYPEAKIGLVTSDSRNITQRVAQNELEIGVVGAQFRENKVTFEKVLSDELVLVVYPGHPLSRESAVRPINLHKYPFINREYGSGTRMIVEQNLEKYGISLDNLRIVLEAGSTEAVRHAIKAKIGISILSWRAVTDDMECGALKAIPFDDFKITRFFYLVKHKARKPSPVCKAFIEHLRHWGSEDKMAQR